MSLVTVTDVEHVRVLTLSRPEMRNAMNSALLAELLDAVSDAVAAADIGGIVLVGAGEAFSAGADLREELDHAAQVRRTDLFCEAYETVATSPTPAVAAVAGACVGGGAELAGACDLRVADPSAFFRFPGADYGIPIGPARLIGLVGLGTAKDLVLTSRPVPAEEAQRLGLVQRLTAPGEALRTATEVAATIAGKAPEAIRYLKRQFDRFSGLGDRIAAENDALHALAEAGGDYRVLTMPKPGVGGWSGGSWTAR
jgi:enoyl-CoA hydratase/carnithine racemase